jgi:hypothetical protein
MDQQIRRWVTVGAVVLILAGFVFFATVFYFSDLKQEISARDQAVQQLRDQINDKIQEVAKKDETIKSLQSQISEVSSKKVELEQKQPRGEIENVWVEHNQFRGFRKGMVIHIKFSLYNAQSIVCELDAYFFGADGKTLRDNDGAYESVTQQVSVGQTFVPESEVARYGNYELFLPYDLKFKVQVSKKLESSIFYESEYYGFKFTQS